MLPIPDTAAKLFYHRLFELDPKPKSLFKEDMAEQRRKLMTMIAAAVRSLDDLNALVPAVQEFGGRRLHARCEAARGAVYGVLARTTKEAAA